MATSDLSGLATPGTTTSASDPLSAISGLLQLITSQQFPSREAGFLDVLNAFVQRAGASPQALGQLATPQLQQQAQAIMQAMRGLSTTFGPDAFGGAQMGRLRGQAIGSNTPYDMFLKLAMQGQQQTGQFLGGAGLIAPTGTTKTMVEQPGFDPNATAKTAQGLAQLLGQGYEAVRGLFGQGNPTGPTDYTQGAYTGFGTNYSGTGAYPGAYGGNYSGGMMTAQPLAGQ